MREMERELILKTEGDPKKIPHKNFADYKILWHIKYIEGSKNPILENGATSI